MSGLNYLKLGSTLSNICNSTQLDNSTKFLYAFKNFIGEPCVYTCIYIAEIYMKKQCKSSVIKNYKIKQKKCF